MATNVSAMGKIYDLEERTAVFGERVIILCKSIKQTPINRRIVEQLIGSSASIGANYMEANGACSKKDFQNKIFIVKKECKETKHHLRLLAAAHPERKEELRTLWRECQELTCIFSRIANSCRERR